jgi:hypothetical protein
VRVREADVLRKDRLQDRDRQKCRSDGVAAEETDRC